MSAAFHKGIATVSLSGVLSDKLTAIADAGFDGVEIFDNDLIAAPMHPAEVATRCADLGLSVDLFQPVRDVEGVRPEEFGRVLHRLRRKFETAQQLGAPVVLACSNVSPTAIDDPGLRAEQLHRIGELAAAYGIVVAYEALAWGRHVNRVRQSWRAVQDAGHPAITLAVDTFHMLARRDDGAALDGIPGDRIGFLQVADAPMLDMNVLEWSRHFRCFPGQGTLDVAGVVSATLEAGYAGPVSLEVFSDVVREAPPAVTARDAMRSLLFLQDQVTRELPTVAAHDVAFVELAAPPGDSQVGNTLAALGFRQVGVHRTKPVTWWRNGGASIVLNEQEGASHGRPQALGLVAPSVCAIQDRARALDWPELRRTRGADETALPGITAPSGIHVFISAPPGEPDDWHLDFGSGDFGSGDADADGGGWLGVDHVGVTVTPDRLDEETAFRRVLLGLEPGSLQEFIQPHGRLQSRALRPERGGLRVVLNVSQVGAATDRPSGITQLAFACRDAVAEVDRLRAAGVELMPVPDNYYDDLDARLEVDPGLLRTVREHRLLYDRDDAGGELLHAYTMPREGGHFIEILERRGGYDGYGAANTHVRLAAQLRE
ncbi:MAG TPA: TIM barrel protein [Flexivirga sp.]|uniref:sugar phosphate isomerase/epimerase and 4-hydroxyphenylpyruvate domain-containing protein n=1 Tax=Flexivirga sp. TaxID=1962927 RepID=UPI002CF81973|nr:TIM barrel protein [Flexivirga sp.]HWC23628.1 TIM barrel protein [Flexivirga sp.]